MSVRYVLFLALLALLGLGGCRGPSNAVSSRDTGCSTACRTTGPLSRSEAEKEALAAVSSKADKGTICSIASVREQANVYAVCVRIDAPPTEKRQLPEHWTVEVPKDGITQSGNPGSG